MPAKPPAEIQKSFLLINHTGNVWGAVIPDDPKGLLDDMSFGVDGGRGRWESFECYFMRRPDGKKKREVELRFFDRSDPPFAPTAKLTLVVNHPAK